MDTTPETPDHVPASAEVREAHELEQRRHRVQILRAKRNGPWYFVAILGIFGMSGLLVSPAPNRIVTVYAVCIAIAYTLMGCYAQVKATNRAYRAGYSSGVLMGLVGSARAIADSPDGNIAIRVRAGIPNIWEDELVHEEISAIAPAGCQTKFVDEDDDDETRQ